MKLMSFLFLSGGWAIFVAAVWLLRNPTPRVAFALSGLAVQVLGLVFAIRTHRTVDVERG